MRLTHALAAGLCLSTAAAAQSSIATVKVGEGFAQPTAATTSPDDADRIIVCEQRGRIRVLKDGLIEPVDFLDLSGVVSQAGNERGLFDLEFHPDYTTNGWLYVSYTDAALNHATIVERYTISADPDVVDASSGVVIFGPLAQPDATHQAGDLNFGPLDGKLYVSLGDGGPANDPTCNAQNGLNHHGTILRLNDDGSAPADNPFVGDPTHLDEIWAAGLRNPWRMTVDRQTGDVWIGDVGQGQREEIDFIPSGVGGLNFGWKIMEGFNCHLTAGCPPGTPGCGDAAYTLPVLDYSLVGPPCAVIGGFVYRGCNLPDFFGHYMYADHCAKTFRSFTYDGTTMANLADRTVELDPPGGGTFATITSFGEDADGELLIVDRAGRIYRVVAGEDTLQTDVTSVSSSAGGTQTFSLNTWDCTLGNSFYLLLGSDSDTPGFPIDGQVLPLNVLSPLFNFSLANANSPPYGNTFGILDGSGKATATVTFPPGSATSLVGVTIFHAFAVFDVTGPLEVVMASNAAPLTVDP